MYQSFSSPLPRSAHSGERARRALLHRRSWIIILPTHPNRRRGIRSLFPPFLPLRTTRLDVSAMAYRIGWLAVNIKGAAASSKAVKGGGSHLTAGGGGKKRERKKKEKKKDRNRYPFTVATRSSFRTLHST